MLIKRIKLEKGMNYVELVIVEKINEFIEDYNKRIGSEVS